MHRAFRWILPLLLMLGLLTWVASAAVARMSRGWFERDLAQRSQLAVNGAREGLVLHWREGERNDVGRLLEDLTRDQHLMAAAGCAVDFAPVASTRAYPASLGCVALRMKLPNIGELDPGGVHQVTHVGGGDVLLSALPVLDGSGSPVGMVALIHDLGFIQRREQTTHRVYAVGFGVLALLAAAATVLMARTAWSSWTDELRNLMRGAAPPERRRPEFHPVLRDVRELAERMASESDPEGFSARWTADRLKQTLRRHLDGEKVIIVANREPYIHNRAPDGAVTVQHPASGLVTALEPVMRACSGTWVAHGSGSADRDTVDARDRVVVPPAAWRGADGDETYALRRVWLSEEEEQGYYYGFANEGLWPLCHLAHARPIFRNEDFAHYERANLRFAEAVCAEADADDPIILVQDYHFALAPRMIRARLPKATIITFWHIPWPNSERFGICPWHEEILEGLLGSSIVGFHIQQHCNNFLDAVDRFLEARIDREQLGVVHQSRETLVRAYPISIDWPNRWLEHVPPVAECRASVLRELGLRDDALLGVGVDRLDYTKGIEERLLAVERLLDRFPQYRGRFTFVQLGAPSRTRIERYRDLNVEIEDLVCRINARFGDGPYRPIVLRRDHHEPPTVFRYLRAADLCYVSSLHDGMNLVAKEFIAARDDELGVLVLSEFTGAARELVESLIVNPYDLDEASSAMAVALSMPAEEQRERMRAMRDFVAEWNVYRWAGGMLVDAARLREADRLSGRLARRLGDRSSLADKHRVRQPPIRLATPWYSPPLSARPVGRADGDARPDRDGRLGRRSRRLHRLRRRLPVP